MTDTTNEAIAEQPTTGQRLAAELIGAFVLVLVGCGTAVLSGDYLGTALAFGLAVAVMIYAVGRFSGGHFNPAVSVGAAIAGRIAWKDAAAYIGMQILGAILGAATLFLILQGINGFSHGDPVGANGFGDAATGYAVWGAFTVEFVLTALFVLVILAVTDRRNEHPVMAPLAIGLTLTVIHLVAINLTGTSVNPARSIGPALFAGNWDAVIQLWLFVLAPVLGAIFIGGIYGAIFGEDGEPVPGSGLRLGRNRDAAVPGYGAPDQYQQQWNQAPQAGWSTPPAAAPGYPQQGQPPQGYPQQGQPQPGYPQQGQPTAAPGWSAAPEPQQWGTPQQFGEPAPPAQQPGQPYGQPYGQPQQPPPNAPPAWEDEDGEDGRTQIRPNNPT